MAAGKSSVGNEGQMKAMVLAAGLGTRLRPLTDNRPKALVEIDGRSLLEITLTRLKQFGVRDVIVNVHHFADMVIDYLKAHQNFGMHIEISREDVLLDTGGGLKKAAWFFLDDPPQVDQPFLLHNVDVISTIDFRQMLDFHKSHNALATLAVQNRGTSRYLLFDDTHQLCGRRAGRDGKLESAGNAGLHARPEKSPASEGGRYTVEATASAVPIDAKRSGALAPEVSLHALAFSGIHVISPRFLTLMLEDGVFSIIDTYLQLASGGEKILAFNADQYYWRDLGKLDQVQQATEDRKQKLF
jgi:mannose-1-phosphate guanylyltransferase